MLLWSPRRSLYDQILPWYTDDIGVEKSTRPRLERRWRPTLLPEHRLAYVAQCKLVKGLVLNAKRNTTQV